MLLTSPQVRAIPRLSRWLLFKAIALLCATTQAVEYVVDVTGVDGAPLAGAVVYLEPTNPDEIAAASPAAGVMDQVDRQFKPYILVVQRGSDVSFPNSDSIKHHVFSFSDAKTFELKLYKGEQADPLRFDEKGEVELGCNVHDWMLGYIYVVDTPYFGRSNERGRVVIEAPMSEYEIGVWHPRIDSAESLIKTPLDRSATSARIAAERPLLSDYRPGEAVEFDDYD